MRQKNLTYGSGGGSGTVNDVTTVIDMDVFDSSHDQTEFILSFNYTVGEDELLVSSGGMEMTVGVDYDEINSNTISFYDPREDDEVVVVRKIRSIVS